MTIFLHFYPRRVAQAVPQIFLLLFLIFTTAATAEQAVPQQASPALWKLARENGNGHVYLFGSFHVLPRELRWFTGEVRKAFEEVDELVFETSMTTEAQSETALLVMSRSMLPAGYSLKGLLEEEDYARAVQHAAALGLEERQVSRLQPWYLALTLSVQSIMSYGLDPNSGVEKIMQALAEARGLTISGLETPQEQIMALSDHPLEVQTAMLVDTLDKLSDFETYISAYIEAWASGKDEVIAARMIEDMKKYPQMYQAVLVQRNKNWIPKLTYLINSGKSVMVVVGAAHLVGQDGLIRMLEEKGYHFEKVQ
ncbi:TraB/GumN family protein [Luteithermobacter gelatinilyticus]|uniref:TraB/GumN family protein n=1 Tax=Luteithermobacter gelatinilyticus TaxID=2582913 RepID=UPI001105C943|nr:TraB/GumN family protein [Luteithermobacter gelatinilyticus]